MSMKLSFVGIGAPKAGTTQLAEMIAAHPELCLSEPKEVHYFNKIQSYIHGKDNPNFDQDLDWYQKHFAHCSAGAKIGEFSTGYMYDRNVAQRIKQLAPDVKIIACLREPVSRAYSQFTMHRYYLQKENRSFEETIADQSEYIEKGRYYQQLMPYFEAFPKQQIFVVLLKDLKQDAAKVARELYAFLEVDADFQPPNLHARANAAKASKYRFISEWMGYGAKLFVALGLSGLLAWLKRKGLKKWIIENNSKQVDYPQLSKRKKQELSTFFQEDIAKLEVLIDRDLSHWKLHDEK